jgi:hypothetical protein
MGLDETATDQDFRDALQDSHGGWLETGDASEPDLSVDGLGASLFVKLLGLVTGGRRG